MSVLSDNCTTAEIREWFHISDKIAGLYEADELQRAVDEIDKHLLNRKLPLYHHIKFLLVMACCVEWEDAEDGLKEARSLLTIAEGYRGRSAKDGAAALAVLQEQLALVEELHDDERPESVDGNADEEDVADSGHNKHEEVQSVMDTEMLDEEDWEEAVEAVRDAVEEMDLTE